MAEQLRYFRITLEADTNKRTLRETWDYEEFDGDLDELLGAVKDTAEEWIDEIGGQ